MESNLQSMPLWRDANQLLVLIEQEVRHFPRYHKYALGLELRQQAMKICRLIVKAYGKSPPPTWAMSEPLFQSGEGVKSPLAPLFQRGEFLEQSQQVSASLALPPLKKGD